MSRIAAWLAGLFAVACGFAALILGVIFFQLARLPFNAQGRHFDDGVVHQAQAVPIYGLLVLGFAAVALFALWLSRRLLRRSRIAAEKKPRP